MHDPVCDVAVACRFCPKSSVTCQSLLASKNAQITRLHWSWPAFNEIEAQSTLFAASLKALLPMTAWRTNMLIYPSSWGWRHKTSIGNFKKGYYPNSCIAPLFLAPGERLEALTAFSNFVLHLSTRTGICQCTQCT